MKALVTGAAGFVGANLVRFLLDKGYEVYPIVRESSDLWRLQSIVDDFANDVPIFYGDITQRADIREVVERIAPEVVFHCASYGGYYWHQNDELIRLTNFDGTIHLLDAVMNMGGCKSFVNVGSSFEYGEKSAAQQEIDVIVPHTIYAATKAAATLYTQAIGLMGRLTTVTARLYSAYGPYEDPRRFVPRLVSYGASNEYPPLVKADTARDYIYIDDVCRALETLATSSGITPGQIVNVGTGIETTTSIAAQTAMECLGIDKPPQFGTMVNRDRDLTHWVADPNMLYVMTGFKAKINFRDGLTKTAEWLANSPQHVKDRYLSEVV
jgi:nucleoside-diphosphate-sugar epimerase